MFTIRRASASDEAFLFDMLLEALFVPPGRAPFDRSALDAPEIARYAAGFGSREGDLGYIAEGGGRPIGAVWVRLPAADDRGYGYVDDETPELTIAVERTWRGRGVGTALAERLLDAVPRVSLSSDIRNPATSLYQRLGFDIVTRNGTSVTMVRGE